MMIPFEFAMGLCALAFAGGFVFKACFEARDAEQDHGFVDQSGSNITHIARRNTASMSEKMAEHLRQNLPGFKDMEAARLAADAHADKVRREVAEKNRPAPIMAGLQEIGEKQGAAS